MHTTSRRRIAGLCCLVVALAMPAGLLAADDPAAAPPAAAAQSTGPARPAPPADPTAVLKVIPADAVAFVAVRNLLELDADVLGITQKLGFPLAAIGFPGPLNFAKEHTGISEGLDDNSGLALALLSCAELQTVQEMSARLVVLIPCSDVEALVTSMKGQKQGELISLELFGAPSVAAAKDGFLIVGQNPEVVQDVLRAKGGGIITSISPDRLADYKTQDLFGWASFRGLSEEVRQQLIDSWLGLMVMAGPAARAQGEHGVEQVKKLMEESREFCFGLAIDEKVGLKLVLYYRMRPGTELAQQMEAMKPPSEPLLVGLPDEPVIFAMGAASAGGDAQYEKQIRQMMDHVLSQEILGELVDPDKLKSMRESIVKLTVGLKQMSFSLSALPAENEGGLVGAAFVAKVASSQQAQGELRTLFNMAKELVVKAAQDQEDLPEGSPAAVDEAVQWKQEAEKPSGAVVDHLIVDLAKFPDADSEKIEEIKGVVGQEGVLVRVAAVGDSHVAITFGGGAKRFARIVEHIEKGQAPLADKKAIKMVADRLPPPQNRLAEGYFSVDRLLALVMSISKQVGQPMMFPLMMKETAPIAYTMSRVDNTAIQADVLIPIELAQSAMELAGPFIQMALMGGAGMPGQPPMPQLVPEPAPDNESELK